MAPAPTAADVAFVHSVARRILGAGERAADTAQNALMSAHIHRAQFAGRSGYRTWLYRIAACAALSELRKQRRRPEEADEVDLVDCSPSPEDMAANREQLDRLGVAVSQLPPECRKTFSLRILGYSDAEIAAALGITASNVKVRAHRVRARMRDLAA